MLNALIIYGSLTGNTAQCAAIIGQELESLGVNVTIFEAMEADPEDLLDYDILLIGSYTFGDDAELPDEMLDYHESLPGFDLAGKPFGVFGSGDDYYPKFATAVDDFEEAFLKAGASKVSEGVKVNIAPDTEEEIDALKDLAHQLAAFYQ